MPDDDGFYQRYLETCRAAGVEPVSRERMRELVGDWNTRLSAPDSTRDDAPRH